MPLSDPGPRQRKHAANSRRDIPARLGYPDAAMSDHADPAVHPPRGAAAVFDARAVAAELKRLGGLHAGRERELRSAVAQYLKGLQAQGLAAAEGMLREDRHGRLCAERLCFMQDELIRLLFEFAGKQLYRSDHPF